MALYSVIPGRREAASPESITAVVSGIAPTVDMDSGLAAFGRAPE
jgi:hypothetical protein